MALKMPKLFPAEERLLVLLNLAKPSEGQRAEVRELAKSGSLDWEKLFKLAELNAVIPLALTSLRGAGLETLMPTELLESWEAMAAPIRERNERRVAWAGKFLGALHDA